jgi:hypothetical protein
MSIYLGTTPLANTGYDKANTSLSNLTSQGKNIANWSNNVTNCITEIPQDIKLELNDGTLTLKAGSKVYIPNGFEADGTTPKFDVVTVASDIDAATFGTDGDVFQIMFAGYSSVYGRNSNQVFSGSTAPTLTTYMVWYDTTNNLIKHTSDGGSTWSNGGDAFPLSISSTASSSYTSIKQVFNGFGYIGSTVFALPGVKGLIPNGRNEDGSLKNIEFNIDSVKTATRTWVDPGFQVWGYTKNPPTGVGETWYWNSYIESDEEPSYNEYVMWYKPSENVTYVNNGAQSSTPNWEKVNYINFGKASGINSQEIKIFTPRTAFHALDYNDSSTISGWSMPSSRYENLTLGASGATYTAPANGYFILTMSGATNGVHLSRLDGFGISYNPRGDGFWSGILPARKSDTIVCYYGIGTSMGFKFIYAEGE